MKIVLLKYALGGGGIILSSTVFLSLSILVKKDLLSSKTPINKIRFQHFTHKLSRQTLGCVVSSGLL